MIECDINGNIAARRMMVPDRTGATKEERYNRQMHSLLNMPESLFCDVNCFVDMAVHLFASL